MGAPVGVWLALAFLFLMFAIVIGIVWTQRRNRKRFFDQLTQSLGAVPVKRPFFSLRPVNAFTIPQGGLDFEAQYRQGRRRAQFILSVSVEAPVSFQISSGRRWIQLLRSFGLGKGVSTDDPTFDGRFYVDTNSAEFMSDFLTPQKRQSIQALFSPGFYTLELDGGRLTAIWSPFWIKKDSSIDFVRDAVGHLQVLIKDIPAARPYEASAYFSEKWFDSAKNWMYGIIFFAFFSFGIMSQGEVVDPGLGWSGLKYSGIALLLLSGLALYWLGKKPWFGRVITRVILPGLILIPWTTTLLLKCVNNRLDDGPISSRKVEILGKHTTGSGSDTAYRLEVKSWRAGEQGESIRVRKQEYDRIVPGQSVLMVATKPGRLGYEWIVSAKLETPSVPSAVPQLASQTVSPTGK